MPDDAPPKTPDTPSSEETPHAFVSAGHFAWTLDAALGVLALALGVWYGLRRPTIAVLATAVLLAGYALFHVWQRYEERPDRGRRPQREPTTRRES